jgi:hypothetical protein
MTSPMTGVPEMQAAMLAQQPQGMAPPEKLGESKFDGVLADKAQAAAPVHAVEPATPAMGPVLSAVNHVVRELEQGQQVLDRIIRAAGRGKQFTNAELLSLQASMYRYTQELELVSKVVEKGTTGLKDVLKTQV